MKAAGIRYEKRRPPSVGRRRRPRELVAKARSRGFSIDGCVNDAIGRRTSMSRSGSAYANPDTIAYTYNDRSELTGAVSNVDTTYSYSYVYDPIGNRVTASEAGVPWTYTTNSLNQYTSATENNVQLNFAYDLDGSMTYRPVDATSGWTQVWNGENRMVETTKGTDRLTFKYDYMGRRVEKCVYSGNTLISKTFFVYDGFKCVEELDALDNNSVLMRHIWQSLDVGLDVILTTTDGISSDYYLFDANKNAIALMDIANQVNDIFIYNPYGIFGHIGNSSKSFLFSSEYFDGETGMVYYNYRYYSPKLGRWLSKDPFEEVGGELLYAHTRNNPISTYDTLGMIPFAKISSCFAECFIKEFLGKELIVYLSKGDFAGTVKRICESELRLPNPNEVLSKYYKRSFALPAVECVAKCFAKQIPYVGSIISDSITIEANYIILSASSFKCNNIKREINFLLKYRVIIHVKMNSKNVYTENLGYETNYKRLGLVPWCRCCQ